MRIIGGKYKGRTIPFTNSRYGNADITMQMVKEAVFDILSARVRDKSFLDLFSCSGQIGLEALSRGASSVVMNEKDRRRYEFLRSLRKEFSLGDETEIMNLSWERCIRDCAAKGKNFSIIYCDPPYVKEKVAVPLYGQILAAVDAAGILQEDGLAVMQHHYGNILDGSAGKLVLADERKYGQTALSFYMHNPA
ncbi:MAG: 16S rRNA (guanine(966)-N(2))-methyltransferase RsmD [Spirochaetota bacterium]